MKKTCKKCNKLKLIDEFVENKRCVDGYEHRCKECRTEYRKRYKRQYREKNKNDVLAKDKIYRQKNKEKITEQARKYRAINKEKMKEYARKYYSESPRNREKINLCHKRNRVKLPDYYIKELIARSYGINFKSITPKMIEIKRELITFHRLTKELRNGTNSARNQRT